MELPAKINAPQITIVAGAPSDSVTTKFELVDLQTDQFLKQLQKFEIGFHGSDKEFRYLLSYVSDQVYRIKIENLKEDDLKKALKQKEDDEAKIHIPPMLPKLKRSQEFKDWLDKTTVKK
jgi:hypothetical protein